MCSTSLLVPPVVSNKMKHTRTKHTRTMSETKPALEIRDFFALANLARRHDVATLRKKQRRITASMKKRSVTVNIRVTPEQVKG